MLDIEVLQEIQKSPITFAKLMWGLEPQPLKPEWKLLADKMDDDEFRPEMFEEFVFGKHLTWQQWLLLRAVERAIQGKSFKRISVKSGHGTGKSASLSIIILWYLFSFKDAQIPATAPTSDQIHDVLWKELAAWISRMPSGVKELYQWSTEYIRMAESPNTWFARAKTARKESPEALAGVHGEYVLYIADEASGIPEEIFNTAEGALTNKNAMVIMTSNPTRLVGYFYNSHKEDSKNWQTLTFNSKESPIVDEEYTARIIERHGEDSDEYKIRVLGQFPREDAVDDKGYVALFNEEDLKFTDDDRFMGTRYMGVDPAGEGDDTSSWVVRDNFKAQIVATEKISTEKSIALKTIDLAKHYEVSPENIFIDNFGVGANVSRELIVADPSFYVTAVNVGKEAEDGSKFLNKRAEAYYSIKQWMRNGGLLIKDNRWKQLLNIRYRRQEKDQMQIMSKKDMRKEGIKSPNEADALMLTFAKGNEPELRREAKQFKKTLKRY